MLFGVQRLSASCVWHQTWSGAAFLVLTVVTASRGVKLALRPARRRRFLDEKRESKE